MPKRKLSDKSDSEKQVKIAKTAVEAVEAVEANIDTANSTQSRTSQENQEERENTAPPAVSSPPRSQTMSQHAAAKPTPAKNSAQIKSDRTTSAFGSSQGDHIIANALIKSFLLSVDSIQDETSFSDQADIFIAKTKDLLKVAEINDFNDARINELLEEVKKYDESVQKQKNITISNFADNIVGVIKALKEDRFCSEELEQLSKLSATLPISPNKESVKKLTREMADSEQAALDIEEDSEVSGQGERDEKTDSTITGKTALEPEYYSISNENLSAHINSIVTNISKKTNKSEEFTNDVFKIIATEYNAKVNEANSCLDLLRQQRNAAFSNLARDLTTYCTKNITLLSSPNYSQDFANELKGIESVGQEGSAKSNLMAISNLLNDDKNSENIQTFLTNIFNTKKSTKTEALQNIATKHQFFINCTITDGFKKNLITELSGTDKSICDIPIFNSKEVRFGLKTRDFNTVNAFFD
ncbi:hypothetical protein N9O56_02770, partial [Rickettsiales bacterium]|nr:hypothetical protein [Rickettsiales bacterium]